MMISRGLRKARGVFLALVLLTVPITLLKPEIALTIPLTKPAVVAGTNILDNISGLLFNTFNNVLDTTQSFSDGSSTLSLASDVECELEQAASNSTCLPHDPDAARTVPQIIKSRGFQVEELEVITDDGYILMVHRIINPLVPREQRASLKPVLLQHGLMTCSVDWVINSMGVKPRRPVLKPKPAPLAAVLPAWARPRANKPQAPIQNQNQSRSTRDLSSNGLGLFLANEGYDVFLANSRGNAYSKRHINMSPWTPAFWDFTFDQLIKFDLPATLKLVQQKTNRKKVAYVGHSQGTSIMFGLLAERPEMADQFEPIIMLAPVAFVGNVNTPARHFASYTPIFEHVNMRFGTSNMVIRYLAPIVCGLHQVVRKELCQNVIFLTSGFNEEEFDQNRLLGYLGHLPSGTSIKNLAHYGQEIISGRFAHFDHGPIINQQLYGQTQAPDYQLARVRSRSIVLFTADTDWLSTPKDIAKLRASLRVTPYKTFNMTQWKPKWSHMDFMYGKSSGRLVNSRILEVLREFDDDDDDR